MTADPSRAASGVSSGRDRGSRDEEGRGEGGRGGGGRSWTSAFLATASGLALLGAATAEWAVATVERDVSGVVVPERIATTGAELEPALLVVGLVVLVAAVPLAVTRGALRRGVAFGVAAAGAAATVVSVRATLQAGDVPGRLQPVVGIAYLAAIGAVVAGALGAGRARRPAPRTDPPAPPGPPVPPEQPASPSSGSGRRPTSEPVDEWALAVDDEDA